jgi:(1->4)-alpha-D-glucan 1-alpha-D-glucosylmutase
MRPDASKRIPGATYRLQFNDGFTFKQATEIAEYLRELGITDLYASPIFTAGPGSTHGYDICSFEQVNPALGGAEEFDGLAARLQQLGLGLLLDMVPNHMAVDGSNDWWQDVLRNGRASRFATWFDIDWKPSGAAFPDKVLLPLLEDHYAKVLEAGKLRLDCDQGEFVIKYHDRKFPISPESASELVLGTGSYQGTAGRPQSFDKLHALLQRQHYRLACWRAAAEEINYRRFFDVTGLIGLRMELPEVFLASHQLLFSLLSEGKVTGLRIDHPDGLWNPREYCQRLQTRSPDGVPPKPGEVEASAPQPFYVVVEKILTGAESLPRDWPVDGTTGYDFLNHLNGLFVNSANRGAFDRLYQDFTGRRMEFSAVVYESKRRILETSLRSETDALTHRLRRIAASTRYGQDFGFQTLRSALIEIIAGFPVYRTYADENTMNLEPVERERIEQALRTARARNPVCDPEALTFIENLLLLRIPKDVLPSDAKEYREFAMKFQQLTGPVTAKGVEDTAFYNFNRLISLNEVGGDPEVFGTSSEEFHRYNLAQAERWPHSLLATATHDTKRGEDGRARINVLSELPGQWREAILRWSRLNADKKSVAHGEPAPRPNDEYLFYQTLIGSWITAAEGGAGRTVFCERLVEYMLKAVREAKAHTTWTDPDLEYEEAVRRFVQQSLEDFPFVEDFRAVQQKTAFFGRFNSLSQLLLKMTCPGIPDLYQGTELWDFNLVDPDNRRPVDYALRQSMFKELKDRFSRSSSDLRDPLGHLLREPETGLVKMYLIWRALNCRTANRGLFDQGSYIPLQATGSKKTHICAFARKLGSKEVIAIAPRLVVGLVDGVERPPMGDIWEDTLLALPDTDPKCQFQNVLTRQVLSVAGGGGAKGGLRLADALGLFPVALLERI